MKTEMKRVDPPKTSDVHIMAVTWNVVFTEVPLQTVDIGSAERMLIPWWVDIDVNEFHRPSPTVHMPRFIRDFTIQSVAKRVGMYDLLVYLLVAIDTVVGKFIC